MLTYWKNMKAEIDEYSEQLERKITIGATSYMATQNMLYDYKALHPHLRINQYRILVDEIPVDLKTGICDFVISSIPVIGDALESVILMEQEIGLIVSANHPFATRKSINLAEAKDEKFVSMPKGYAYRQTTDELCHKAGFEPQIAVEYLHSQLLDLVARGLGVGLGIRYPMRETYFQTIIRYIPITSPDCIRHINLLWYKDGYLSNAAKEFIIFAKRYFE
jgi:DNA-binding transcriptional LysR family regulator